ncbi:MAG: DcaP family trimeric outer membrane transporter [Chlorobaculum sp.]
MKANGSFRHALLLAGALLGSSPAMAAEPIEARIASLEKELAELKALVKAQSAPSSTSQTATAPQATNKAEVTTPATVTASSGAKLQFYGFARFDASYDSGRITPGNIALYAPSEGKVNDDAEWNLTANATRIGMNLFGPDTETMRLTGNIEFDFLSYVGAENNSSPRLRHGYLKAYWPAHDVSIIAGQTWDLNGSLIPFVDDPAIMWDAGNIGGRHPQLRLTKGFKTGDKSRVEVAVAAARTIGETNASGADSGKDAAMPSIQGRLALSTPLLVSGKPATIAVSGHYGQEEWDTAADGTHKTLDSWSCVLELSLPLSDKLLFASELFTGANLDDYWGGIGQGRNGVTAIRSHGGWAALRYAASPETMLSIGAGMDDPNDDDLAANARSLNETQFISVSHRITPNFILGGQLSHWRTDYKDAKEGDAVRAQTSVTYSF